MIDQIVTLRKTLSTVAKPRLTMSFLKGNNLIYYLLNYMLFNLLYWMFSLSRLQWCFFSLYFNVSFHIQSIYFYRCSIILLEPRMRGWQYKYCYPLNHVSKQNVILVLSNKITAYIPYFTDDRSIFFFLNMLASTYRPHRPIQGWSWKIWNP